MGAGGSKPGWYPGEPAVETLAECSCAAIAFDTHCENSKSNGCSGQQTNMLKASTAPASNDNSHPSRHRRLPASISSRDRYSLPLINLVNREFIAQGAFCTVYTCEYQGWDVVAKKVRDDLPLAEKRAALTYLWNEYDCLRLLQHPKVIDLYGMCRINGVQDDEFAVCVLLERLALGTVGHLLDTNRNLERNLTTMVGRAMKMKMMPFRNRLDRVLELALALEYVHSGAGLGVMMHRDIKNANIGFAQNGSLKLMDFGLAKVVAPNGTLENDTFKMTGEVGSYRYMAPELVKHKPYNAKADIYSWAIMSWEILAVSRPYAGMNEMEFAKRVVLQGERPVLPKGWPTVVRTLLASAWSEDITARPTAKVVVNTLRAPRVDIPSRSRPSFSAGMRSAERRRSETSGGLHTQPLSNRKPSSWTDGGGDEGDKTIGLSPSDTPTRKRFSFSLGSRPPMVGRPPVEATPSARHRRGSGTSRRDNSVGSRGGSGSYNISRSTSTGPSSQPHVERRASAGMRRSVSLSTVSTLSATDSGSVTSSASSGSDLLGYCGGIEGGDSHCNESDCGNGSTSCASINCCRMQEKGRLSLKDKIIDALAREGERQNFSGTSSGSRREDDGTAKDASVSNSPASGKGVANRTGGTPTATRLDSDYYVHGGGDSNSESEGTDSLVRSRASLVLPTREVTEAPMGERGCDGTVTQGGLETEKEGHKTSSPPAAATAATMTVPAPEDERRETSANVVGAGSEAVDGTPSRQPVSGCTGTRSGKPEPTLPPQTIPSKETLNKHTRLSKRFPASSSAHPTSGSTSAHERKSLSPALPDATASGVSAAKTRATPTPEPDSNNSGTERLWICTGIKCAQYDESGTNTLAALAQTLSKAQASVSSKEDSLSMSEKLIGSVITRSPESM